MFVSSLLLIAAVQAGFVFGGSHFGCDVDVPITPIVPVRRGTIRLPRGSEIMPLSEFADKIVGKTLYGFIAGADPNEGAGLFTKAEVTYRDLNQDNVTFDFISEFNNTGVCVNASIFSTNVFDIAGNGDRAAFSLPNGRYNVLFSSQPESYIWNLQCAQSGGRTLRCPSENLSVVLLTLASPPNNINLEEIGSDLRRRTCLTMEEIPDTFTWAFIQGQNNCTEIVVPGNK